MTTNAPSKDASKEDLEIELSKEAYSALCSLAASRGVSIDQIVEDILKESIAAYRSDTCSEQS